ncbi:unnamed protein product [Pylaiella littoralis]
MERARRLRGASSPASPSGAGGLVGRGGGVGDGEAGVGAAGLWANRALQAETPAPAVVEVPATTGAPEAVTIEVTPAPEVPATTDAPEAVTVEDTPAPAVQVEETPAPTPVAAETVPPTPAVEGATPAPSSLDGTPAPSILDATLAPSELDVTPAPTVEGSPGVTRLVTLEPTVEGSLFPTAAPLSDGETFAPSLVATSTPQTASPTDALSSVEEALDTTGDVVSNTATVAVATTAAVVTVTATTAATTATAAATTVTTTSTVTTASSAAATGGSGAGGSTTVSTVNTATTATSATTTGGTTTSSSLTTASGDPTRTLNVNNTSTGSKATTTMSVDPGSVSSRSPSATLGLLMIFQMQFLSTLRLLEANITTPFMNFIDSLKWMNLHFDVDISFFSCDEETTTVSLSNDDNGTWALNTFLVFGLLIALIVVHILFVSYLEAAWLSQANAIHRHRLDFIRSGTAQEAAAPFDGRTQAAYAKYLDAQNQDRDLYEQEKASAERYLKRHHSVWMYFPHVELLFLLLAYQGASAAEAQMISSGCFPLVVMGLCALVLFPLLMLIYVNRIVWSRVRPSTSPLRFEPDPDYNKGCFLFKACAGTCKAWRTGTSMLAWADKGRWLSKNDEEVDFDSRKFRIGFEPLFVDYTQKGTLYLTYLLFEWFAFGLIAGFVTNGAVQTGIIFLIYVVDFLILLCLRPFSNSMIQCFTTMTVLADALTLGLMFYATFLDADDDGDADTLELVYAGALAIQTLAILFFVIPLYLDAFVTILGTLCKACSKILRGSKNKAKAPIKGTRAETTTIFCTLVRENFVGCVKSTWKGPSYKSSAPSTLERRRSSLLLPRIDEDSDDEETPPTGNPGFGILPSGPVRSTQVPSARNPRVTSLSNVLEDISDDEGPGRGRNYAGGSAGAAPRDHSRRNVEGGGGGSRSSSSRNAEGGRIRSTGGGSVSSASSTSPGSYGRAASSKWGGRR